MTQTLISSFDSSLIFSLTNISNINLNLNSLCQCFSSVEKTINNNNFLIENCFVFRLAHNNTLLINNNLFNPVFYFVSANMNISVINTSFFSSIISNQFCYCFNIKNIY